MTILFMSSIRLSLSSTKGIGRTLATSDSLRQELCSLTRFPDKQTIGLVRVRCFRRCGCRFRLVAVVGVVGLVFGGVSVVFRVVVVVSSPPRLVIRLPC